MCALSGFQETIPLWNISVKMVVKAPFLYQGGINVDNPKKTRPNVYVNAVSASCQGAVNYFYKSHSSRKLCRGFNP